MHWQELINEKPFITALSDEYVDKEDSPICRYAVWTPGNDMMGHRIAEVGNNLQMLKDKYKVSDEGVLEMN